MQKAILSFIDGNYFVIKETVLVASYFDSHLHRTNYFALPQLRICRGTGLLHFTSDGAKKLFIFDTHLRSIQCTLFQSYFALSWL